MPDSEHPPTTTTARRAQLPRALRTLPTMAVLMLRGLATNAPAATAPAPAAPQSFRSGTLVIVRDEHGAGSGFLAEQEGKLYLFTNAHVAAGMMRPVFTLLDGSRLTPTSIEVAVGRDIIRFGLKETPAESLSIASGVEQTVHLSDDVAVYGNSGGGGVVTSLPGKVVGLGPDRVEVSSPFIPGNSGSPIIHVPTGRVIGIATYLTKDRDGFTKTEAIRRFGFRLDGVKKWEPVNWLAFQADADRIEKIAKLTEDILNFLGSMDEKKQPQFATDTLRKPAEVCARRSRAASSRRPTARMRRRVFSAACASWSAATWSRRRPICTTATFARSCRRNASPATRFTRTLTPLSTAFRAPPFVKAVLFFGAGACRA